MLRGEERDVNADDIQLLDEIEMCSSTERSQRTRADYHRLQEHFVCFLEGHSAKLATAQKKHVQFFVAHLAERSVIVQRLAEKCSVCQAHGARSEGYSPSYVKRHLSAIAAAYEYLVEEKVAAADPSHMLKRPRVRATPPVRADRG
jgi:site-specific recombinase XerD